MRLSKTLLVGVHAAMAAGGTLPIPRHWPMSGKPGSGGTTPVKRVRSAAERAAKDKRERKRAKRARDAVRARGGHE